MNDNSKKKIIFQLFLKLKLLYNFTTMNKVQENHHALYNK